MFTDPTWFTLSLVISAIGFVLANYGRKLRRWPHGVAGTVLMFYTYFVPSSLAMVSIAAGVLAALLLAVRFGL